MSKSDDKDKEGIRLLLLPLLIIPIIFLIIYELILRLTGNEDEEID